MWHRNCEAVCIAAFPPPGTLQSRAKSILKNLDPLSFKKLSLMTHSNIGLHASLLRLAGLLPLAGLTASLWGQQAVYTSFDVTEIPLPQSEVIDGFTDTFGRNADGDIYIGVLLGESEIRAAYRPAGGGWTISSNQFAPSYIGSTGAIVGQRPNGTDGIAWFTDRTGAGSAIAFEDLLPIGVSSAERILLVQNNAAPLMYENGSLYQMNPTTYPVDWTKFKPTRFHDDGRIDGFYTNASGSRYAAFVKAGGTLQIDLDTPLSNYQSAAILDNTPAGNSISRTNAFTTLFYGPAFSKKTTVSNFLANSVNDNGIAVGTAAFADAVPPDIPRAAIWEPSVGVRQIDRLLPEGSPTNLLYARAINNSNLFLALGVDANGQEHLYEITANVLYRNLAAEIELDGTNWKISGTYDFPATALVVKRSSDAQTWTDAATIPVTGPDQRTFSATLPQADGTELFRVIATPQ